MCTQKLFDISLGTRPFGNEKTGLGTTFCVRGMFGMFIKVMLQTASVTTDLYKAPFTRAEWQKHTGSLDVPL